MAQVLNAESLAQQMCSRGVAPDTYTLNALLRASASAETPRRALANYLVGRRRGVAPDAVSFSLLAWALRPVGHVIFYL